MLAAVRQAFCSSLFWVIISLTLAQDNPPGKIDCYGWAGNAISNNTQCPGSNTCCLITDYCDPNRFCRQDKQIIIPPCAVTPWSDCANICQYETETGRLPRVVECSDGSFCCDNDPPCCAQNRGIVLNGLGAIVSTNSGLPATTSSIATVVSSSVATTTLSSNAGMTLTPTQSPQPSTSTDLSIGVKAGLGVGAAAGGAAISVLTVLLINRHRRLKTSVTKVFEKQEVHPNGRQYEEVSGEARWHEMHGESQYYNWKVQQKPQEMEGIEPKPRQFFEMEAPTESR